MILLARLWTVQLRITRLSLSMVLLSSRLHPNCVALKTAEPTSGNPLRKPFGLCYFPFRSPLLRESQLISFPSVTKMFQFTELPTLAR